MSRRLVSILLGAILMFGLLMIAPVFAESPKPIVPSAINLSLVRAEVAKGKTIKLTATATGDAIPKMPAYKWQSSDKKVATVQNGTVTGVAAGTATITVTLRIDESTLLSASCEVHVYVAVSTIATKDKSITLNVGSTFTPIVTITPKTATNQSLLWKSDKETIATVTDKGVISAVNCGECIITAATLDGSNKTISIKVFVPSLSTSTTEVNLQTLKPSIVRVKYYSNKNNISLDDKQALNNLYFHDFRDGVLEIRIWPYWRSGTNTLTISDSSSPKSTIKIKILAGSNVSLRSAEAFPNVNNYYKDIMRYGASNYVNQFMFMKATVMQAYNGKDLSWVLAYSKGKYDDLVYIAFPNDKTNRHPFLEGKSIRLQEGDVIEAWVKPTDIYSYETTMGATNYAVQFKPLIIVFSEDTGELVYMDKDIYK